VKDDGQPAVTCEELDELAGALALGAALPEEVAMAREHLATCTRGHPELARLLTTASLLLEAPEPVEPPADLRGRILAAARMARERDALATESPPGRDAGHRDNHAAGVSTGGTAGDRGFDAERREGPPAVLPSRPRAVPVDRRGRWGVAGWWTAAAVLLIAVGLGIWNVRLHSDLSAREDRLAAQDQALAALAQGGRLVPFTAAPQVGGAHGVVIRPTGGRAIVALAGVPRPEDGKVYQLWALRAGRAEDLGIFRPDDDGRVVIPLPDLDGADAVAVTVELHRQAQPTGAPVLQASLT
jgi:hypothetical protein